MLIIFLYLEFDVCLNVKSVFCICIVLKRKKSRWKTSNGSL